MRCRGTCWTAFACCFVIQVVNVAEGQCKWGNPAPSPPLWGPVSDLAVWDPDGLGPKSKRLVLAGTSSYYSSWMKQIRVFDGAKIIDERTFIKTIDALQPYEQYLVVGGSFDTIAPFYLTKWDGNAWSDFEDGPTGPVTALGVFKGDLIVSGKFFVVGSQLIYGITRWDGLNWHPMGAGLQSGLPVLAYATAITSYDGALVCAGEFLTAGGIETRNIARWDGAQWSALGDGLSEGNAPTVRCLAVYSGSLFAGGTFTKSGTASAKRIAKWDGTTWLDVGGADGPIETLIEHDGLLVAGGAFSEAGTTPAANVAAFDGQSWTALGSGTDAPVRALATLGDELVVGGAFATAGGNQAWAVARWTSDGWYALTAYTDQALRALATVGYDLFVGGEFSDPSPFPFNHIAWLKYDYYAPKYVPMGAGADAPVRALSVYQGKLVSAGDFQSIGGVAADRIAQTVPSSGTWDPLGLGLNARVNALATIQSELVAGGEFTSAGGLPAGHVARWNGLGWTSLGPGTDGPVHALAAYGTELVAAGQFSSAGGLPASNIARWDGVAWHALGTGTDGVVHALAVAGPDLIVGGEFLSAGGQEALHVARWNSTNWQPMHAGFNGPVFALATFGAIYAGGAFSMSGETPIANFGFWTGAKWSPSTEGGTDGEVLSLFPDGYRMFVGGRFRRAGIFRVDNLATYQPNGPKWDLDGDGNVGQGDLGILLQYWNIKYSSPDLGELLASYPTTCK